jgi:3'-5' exoribonuclease
MSNLEKGSMSRVTAHKASGCEHTSLEELGYGSPKKPALAEAVALNLADNTDARMETLTEIFHADKGKKEWLGFNRLFESNLRRTGDI